MDDEDLAWLKKHVDEVEFFENSDDDDDDDGLDDLLTDNEEDAADEVAEQDVEMEEAERNDAQWLRESMHNPQVIRTPNFSLAEHGARVLAEEEDWEDMS